MGFPENDPEKYTRYVESLFDEYNASSDLPCRLDISIGFAEYKAGQTMEDLICAADEDLYRAKRSKRRAVGG